MGELLDQRGLAHPGLAADEHHPPLSAGSVAQMLLELLQVLFALE